MGWERWGTDWGGEIAAPPRRPRKPPAHFERVTFQHTLTRADTAFPEIVDRVREKLADSAANWCETHGYLAGDGSWETAPNTAFETVTMRLTVEIEPRTDGEWPALHRAIAEDKADREAAERSATARLAESADRASSAMARLHDRLDALGAAAAVWSASTPLAAREALRSPLKPSTADETVTSPHPLTTPHPSAATVDGESPGHGSVIGRC
jgi:hypothetical protein